MNLTISTARKGIFPSRLFAIALLLLAAASAGGDLSAGTQDSETPEPQTPVLASASGDGQAAIANFKFPGLQCELFAAEPEVGNIIAIHRDYKGRMFVCETYRQGKGIEDNRNHSYWLDDDLQAQTVQDRIDYILKYHPEAKKTYTQFDDRIRVLVDEDNDGKSDVSKVFANRFNAIEMGSGAGVLSYRDNVYYTCIPDVFLLKDTDGDLQANERKSLSTGYGVRFAFRGHDSHGLIVGPDGRLYFSIGDRGYNLAPNMRDPASGAVFRCELDGSNLEVVATGLRNPQELAFDDYGNLFTGDNNSDGGDEARWTYVVPGGDSGWRMYYQYLGDRGPWNRELMWDDENEEKPAYIIPCIKNISDGPSGLEYYPGTGFSDDFNGRFFLCDFRGTPINSGVRSFRNKPVGAFFELVDDEQPIWQTLVTDIDFASDGKLYLSDWVFGWNGEDKGRIYTFYDEKKINEPIVKEVESILGDGLADRALEEVSSMLSHKDQRVRQEAQFEIVRRGEMDLLRAIAVSSDKTLPRLHAIWGLDQLLRSGKSANTKLEECIVKLFDANDEHVRRETVKLAADHFPYFRLHLENLCSDKSPVVRAEAAQGLGKIGDESSMEVIQKLLAENDNKDPIVRHGGVMAIRGIAIKEHEKGESTFIDAMATSKSAAIRLATVVALRKQFQFNELNGGDNTYVVRLLNRLVGDDDESVALDAARAVHDLQMDDGMETLAKLVAKKGLSDHMIRRAISANNRIGDKESAIRLATFAADSEYDSDRKIDALKLLGEWESPYPHDPVTGAYRVVNTSKRKVSDATVAVSSVFESLSSGDAKVVASAVDVAAKLKVKAAAPKVKSIVLDENADAATRGSALASLENMNYEGLSEVLGVLESKSDSLPPALASVYVDVLSRVDSKKAVKILTSVISDSDSSDESLKQKQSAFATMGSMKDSSSEQILVGSFEALKQNKLEPALQLDVLKAMEARGGEAAKKADTYSKGLAQQPVMADRYLWAMKGGDPVAGEKVFREKTEVSCVRCHRVDGLGGKVGPNLSGIAKTYDRRGILESIVDPNLKIAAGHGQIIVATDDGLLHTGIVKEETDTQLALMDPDGVVTRLDIDTIEGRKEGKSSMPEDLAQQLSRDELRDLVEYLVERVTPVEPVDAGHE